MQMRGDERLASSAPFDDRLYVLSMSDDNFPRGVAIRLRQR